MLGAREEVADPVVSEPILRRLSDDEIALVEAAELFNATQFRRTIARSRALGEAKASIIPLSGVNAEVVLTFGWDLSWYQYRVSPESAQPVRIAERGQDLSELDPGYREWNATVTRTVASFPTSSGSDRLRPHVRRCDLHLGSSIAAA